MSERLDNTLAAETPMAHPGGVASAGLPRIALLYSDEALLAHVEQTLAALRVPVVYRAGIEQVDHAALKGAGPEIALINLDDRCGDKLDAVTAALDAAGVPIVFNDADISNGLEGWARARWARHLCAKLCGKDDVDPPRPTQATVKPLPAAATPAAPVAEAAPAAVTAAPSPAPVAEIAPSDPPAVEPPSASRPLSQGEIDALVADFPSEAVVSGAETEEWSAHIDALLANAQDSASRDPAPWEVVGLAEEDSGQPAPAPASAAAPARGQAPGAGSPAGAGPAVSKPAAPVIPSSVDQWQLVDDFTPVVTAAREKPAPAPATSFGSGLALELEPLDPKEDGQ